MKKKFNIGRFLGVLTMGTLITSLLCMCVVGAFARFKSTATGTVEAGVAKFEVIADFTGTSTDFSLSEGENTDTATYTFSVTSKSEVAVSYDVVLTLPSVLPNGVTFEIDGVAPTPNEEGLIYTFAEIGTFTASGETNTHELAITATDFSIDASLDNIKVKVIASQIRPND